MSRVGLSLLESFLNLKLIWFGFRRGSCLVDSDEPTSCLVPLSPLDQTDLEKPLQTRRAALLQRLGMEHVPLTN